MINPDSFTSWRQAVAALSREIDANSILGAENIHIEYRDNGIFLHASPVENTVPAVIDHYGYFNISTVKTPKIETFTLAVTDSFSPDSDICGYVSFNSNPLPVACFYSSLEFGTNYVYLHCQYIAETSSYRAEIKVNQDENFAAKAIALNQPCKLLGRVNYYRQDGRVFTQKVQIWRGQNITFDNWIRG